jgi:outer membrane immunogenic protein
MFGRHDSLLIDLRETMGIGPMKKLLLATVTLVVLAGGPAAAADLGRKAPAYIPPPAPPAPTFTGCYVNGGGGYGLWNIDHSTEFGGQQITTETTSGGRGWLGRVGGGCDYQFGTGSGFWGNWVVGAFADYDFMDLHKNFDIPFFGIAGEEKEKSAWAVGGRIGYLVTPNVFTYWNGGYTETRFDQINLNGVIFNTPGATIGSNTYHGWFIGGGTEIALSGLFGLPLPAGLFWRSEYRYSSFDSADLPIFTAAGAQTNFSEHMRPFVQTITTSLVYKFNWWGH